MDKSGHVTICHFIPYLGSCDILLQNENIQLNKAPFLAETLDLSITFLFRLTMVVYRQFPPLIYNNLRCILKSLHAVSETPQK